VLVPSYRSPRHWLPAVSACETPCIIISAVADRHCTVCLCTDVAETVNEKLAGVRTRRWHRKVECVRAISNTMSLCSHSVSFCCYMNVNRLLYIYRKVATVKVATGRISQIDPSYLSGGANVNPHGFLRPRKPASQTASQSFRPFLRRRMKAMTGTQTMSLRL